eukprot:scaffold28798_cov64-Phaeocystis_antarctica.AAC.1
MCWSSTYGCSLQRMRLQPPSHAVAAPFTCGCSPLHARLQPPAPTVAGERAARGAGGARPREHGPQEGAGRAAAEGPGRVEGRYPNQRTVARRAGGGRGGRWAGAGRARSSRGATI